ncbi:hypothetical protein ABZW30_45590 [Kitasatospora sp. NPDC004669]|uniref:hypothetical protein n=1 Tax=Kitasatospora sp. NPDC004669 TaxID=3154555 RepID=UPI00339E796D
MAFTATVRWRQPGENEHFLLRRRSFGGDPDGSVDLDLASLTAAEQAGWDSPGTGRPCPTTGTPSNTETAFTVPDDARALRLTFTVRLRVGQNDEEVLSVVQRLTIGAAGLLLPDAYLHPRFALTLVNRGGGSEVRQRVPSWGPSGITGRFLGRHPLITVSGGPVILVGTEFLDVTNLWWGVHFRICHNNIETDFNPWYLEPLCTANPGRLRVLLNTRVVPMLWFASTPQELGKAEETTDNLPLPDGTTVGGYVFLRPLASAYSYPSTDPGVLTSPLHATKGMRNLCRYLLQGHTRSQRGKIGGLPDNNQLFDHSPNTANPLGAFGALPCGMEYALDRSAVKLLDRTRSVRLLLLPVPAANVPGGYGGVVGPGNAGRTAAALRLLWSRGAIGGPGQQLLEPGGSPPPIPPQAGAAAPAGGTLHLADDVWVGAYSSGGLALWTLLGDAGNRASAGRVFVFDTNGFRVPGIDLLVKTAQARRGRLQVRIVWSPFDMGPPGADFLGRMKAQGAAVTVWPTAGDKYFHAPPNADNRWAEYVFADAKPWRPTMFPSGNLGGWWHQFVVFAGEVIEVDPRDPRSVSFMEATMLP